MTILRTDKIAGLESVNAITGSVEFKSHPTGNGTYLSYVDSDRIFNFGDGSFTIEFWMKPNVVDTSVLLQDGDNATIMDYGYGNTSNSANAWFAVHHEDQGIKFAFQNSDQLTSSNFLTANTWHHVSINHVRTGSSGKTTIYGDGTDVGSMSSTQTFTDALNRELTVGNQNNVNRAFDGKLSNVRVCKGKALYTAAYTPPTRQLEVTPETILLCCQSSQDAGMDATGKNLVPHPNDSASAPPKPSTDVPDVGNDHTHGTVLEGSVTFDSLNYMTLPRGTTAQSNRGRGLLLGGYTPTPTGTNLNTITYIDIASSGHDVDFGDLTMARYASGAFSSSTRAIVGGGRSPSRQDRIDYVTIAQTGNAIDFGNLHTNNAYNTGASNQTRGLWFGGNTPTYITRIDYVTIASSGMDAQDFGDLSDARHGGPGVSSPTRAVCMGGYDGSSYVTRMDYVTIATTGSEAQFGELTVAYAYGGGVSNATRGIAGGGANPSGEVNTMEYITIASTGSGKDFGDLIYSREHVGAVSNSTRGVWFGGVTPTYQTDIQYAIIATTGSAANWGDLYVPNGVPKGYISGASDSHGGLI